MRRHARESWWKLSLADEALIGVGEDDRRPRKHFVAMGDEKIQRSQRPGDDEIRGTLRVFPAEVIDPQRVIPFLRKTRPIQSFGKEFEFETVCAFLDERRPEILRKPENSRPKRIL